MADAKTDRAMAALDTMAEVWAAKFQAAGMNLRISVRVMLACPDAEDRILELIKHAHAEGLFEGFHAGRGVRPAGVKACASFEECQRGMGRLDCVRRGCANARCITAVAPWDASQIKQPGWQHVEAAFVEGAREARANPEADEAMFSRAADGYTKRVFEEVDPISEAALRTGSWKAAHGSGVRVDALRVAGAAGPLGDPDVLASGVTPVPAIKIQLGPEAFRFDSFQQWVNKAKSWFQTRIPEPARSQHRYVAVDAVGSVCLIGADFMRARDKGTFPVVVYLIDAAPGVKEADDAQG